MSKPKKDNVIHVDFKKWKRILPKKKLTDRDITRAIVGNIKEDYLSKIIKHRKKKPPKGAL
ncbi:MAG: hypothetical protein A3B07_03315 [Candidatus Yonathbacteria bacterium RIFCSPLOWO2_01_FULL_43_27]|uniref:Uncharacterized protein n=1 Tax=Candidatus Yonathbacteria bacterium RIFCSPLOWO2_01_FULL_43_27 TaxID=1802726 RepID=A0A1G2SEM2_9BACT|nr:MAG: hypothetical protein A2658_00265 [Candidatus Yonathbacteria bacterium RIFCSPHIGHO2_01_FULL_44_19]OHA82891.1 MAG: hypothetical protein A3B07_03315 [Candidatus Yonathbacteria bacterium RIFCSPLOWO2_01_FULL_43_27]